MMAYALILPVLGTFLLAMMKSALVLKSLKEALSAFMRSLEEDLKTGNKLHETPNQQNLINNLGSTQASLIHDSVACQLLGSDEPTHFESEISEATDKCETPEEGNPVEELATQPAAMHDNKTPAKLLFDAMDLDLGIVSVSDGWTAVFGVADGNLNVWLGEALMKDFRAWMRGLVDEALSGGWSPENAKHTFRKVTGRYPNGFKLKATIVLTLPDPRPYINGNVPTYVAMLSAENVGRLRHSKGASRIRSRHCSMESRSSASGDCSSRLTTITENDSD